MDVDRNMGMDMKLHKGVYMDNIDMASSCGVGADLMCACVF